MQKIILASQSPRRKQLLEQANINFEVIVEPTDEKFPSTLSIKKVPVFIARNKALTVKQKHPSIHNIILAADTIVVLNNEVIGKPTNREHAIQILTALSGNTHKVITGVVFLKEDKEEFFADETQVTFHPLSKEQIEFYVDEYKPYDKAGAYAIQEWIGVVGIKSINGDFYNVMGLPISRVIQTLQKLS